MHRVALRRTATYRIETRGTITASMDVFRRQVAETFADPRGWRSAGVGFRRVAEGGDFSVVLAEASTVPSFSPVCSAQWSCRVGRYVIINQMRWRTRARRGTRPNKPLRAYRHMVVNHETGHWLGHGHLGCGGDGRLAPVMMQQSKGLDGCRHNPWPLAVRALVLVAGHCVGSPDTLAARPAGVSPERRSRTPLGRDRAQSRDSAHVEPTGRRRTGCPATAASPSRSVARFAASPLRTGGRFAPYRVRRVPGSR